MLAGILCLIAALGSFLVPALAEAQPLKNTRWVDQFRGSQVFQGVPRTGSPVTPNPATPIPNLAGNFVNVTGTVRGFMSGDSILNLRGQLAPAEVACRAVFYPEETLFDGSNAPFEILVPFSPSRFEVDNTPYLQVVCGALERAFEAGLSAKITARIKEWGRPLFAARRANLETLTLSRLDEDAFNQLSMGSIVCEGTYDCEASGTPIRFEARADDPFLFNGETNICSASLRSEETRRLEVPVALEYSYLRSAQRRPGQELALYYFAGVQQCRTLLSAFFGQKDVNVTGAVAGPGTIRPAQVSSGEVYVPPIPPTMAPSEYPSVLHQ